MVTSHRAAALAMRLDVCIEIDIRSPAAERLEVRGWPAQYQPPWSTRSSAHKCKELELTHTIRKHVSLVAPPLRSTLFATGTFCPIDVHRRPRTTQGGPKKVGTRSYGRASTRAPAHRTGPPVGGSSRDAAAARGRT